MRHYSKVIVEFPEGPDDPPYAIVHLDCDVCGEEEIRIHVTHVGTLLRTLGDVVASLQEDGTTVVMGELHAAPTPETRQQVRDYLDAQYPGWKTERVKRAQRRDATPEARPDPLTRVAELLKAGWRVEMDPARITARYSDTDLANAVPREIMYMDIGALAGRVMMLEQTLHVNGIKVP